MLQQLETDLQQESDYLRVIVLTHTGPVFSAGHDLKELVGIISVVNLLLNDKILDMAKLKAFADDQLIIARMMISLLDRVENTMGKGENAGYQYFLLFPQCFPKPSSLGLLKVGIVWKRFNSLPKNKF